MNRPTDEVIREPQPRSADRLASSESIEDVVVPVLKEELEVHKERRRTGTVRVSKTVHEIEETINEHLASETVDVQRVPMDQIVDSPPQIRVEGDVTIIPVLKEELVITKQLRLVEELRVTKRSSVSEYREKIKVSAEEVTVERVGSENLKTEMDEAPTQQ